MTEARGLGAMVDVANVAGKSDPALWLYSR